MEIRRATENDIEGLVENRMDFISSIKNIRPPKTFEDLTYNRIKDQLKNGSLVAWIAVEEKKIVSAVILCITQQIPSPISITGKIGYVYNVFTVPEYRRQGLALKLLEQMKEFSLDNGISFLNLTATEDGFPLYQKAGYKLLEHEMRMSLQMCPASK